MLGKIEYDVKVPERNRISEIVEFYRGFMNDSTHKSVSVDFGEKKNVADISANTLRKHIRANSDDVSVSVRGSVIYIAKNGFEPQKVVIPKVIEQRAVEKAIAKEVETKEKKKRGRPPKKNANVDIQSVYTDWMNGDSISEIAKNNNITEDEVKKLLAAR